MNDLRFFIELLMWLVLFALLSRLWLSIADAKREADSDSNLWKTSLPRASGPDDRGCCTL
jgi:hypothetical protein